MIRDGSETDIDQGFIEAGKAQKTSDMIGNPASDQDGVSNAIAVNPGCDVASMEALVFEIPFEQPPSATIIMQLLQNVRGATRSHLITNPPPLEFEAITYSRVT